MKTGPYDAAIVANSGVAAVAFGQQSLRISNATTSGSFADQTFSAPLTDGAGESTSTDGGQAGGERQPHFDTTFRFLSTTPGAEQPGLAITISPDSGAGGLMSFLRLRDTPTGLPIDFVDVPSAVTNAGHVDFNQIDIAQSLDRTVPHTVRISMDFVPGESNDVVKVYVDDALLVTGSSWENYYRYDSENPSGNVPVVDQLMLRVSGVARPGPAGNGFLIDDVCSRSYGGQGGATGPTGPASPAGIPSVNGSFAEHPVHAAEPARRHRLGPSALPGQGRHLQRQRLAPQRTRNAGPAHLRAVGARIRHAADQVRHRQPHRHRAEALDGQGDRVLPRPGRPGGARHAHGPLALAPTVTSGGDPVGHRRVTSAASRACSRSSWSASCSCSATSL